MGTKTRVTLEQYMRFYENPWRFELARPHLNQIVFMHGFLKLHNYPKRDLLEALDSIDLTPPTRSSLDQITSPSAFLTVDQVSRDLDALGWKECTVQSIESIKSTAEVNLIWDLLLVCNSSTADRSLSRPPPAIFEIRGKRPRTKRKHVSVNALMSFSSVFSSSASTTQPPLSPPLSPPPPPPYSPSQSPSPRPSPSTLFSF